MTTKFKPSKTRKINGGTQKLYYFDNGYGASVVKHSFSYGTELAVIEWYKEHNGKITFDLTYDTPITDDVIGYNSNEDIKELLERISQLKPAQND